MLAITYTPDELRLLECADLAEAAHHKGLYSQFSPGAPACGTPGCLIGNYQAVHGPGMYSTDEFWGVSTQEWGELFSVIGCGNAGRDGLKAAAYVRKFVEERVKARLMV